jgi:hypothetical protein
LKIGREFTTIRKEENTGAYLFDLTLVPPFCIRNAIPFDILVKNVNTGKILQVGKTMEERIFTVSESEDLVLDFIVPGYESARAVIQPKRDVKLKKINSN